MYYVFPQVTPKSHFSFHLFVGGKDKFPSQGLGVIDSVALGAIYAVLVTMAALFPSKSRHPYSIGTVISITFLVFGFLQAQFLPHSP